MRKTLTLKRKSAADLIEIKMMVFNTAINYGVELIAQLDTGNDHTCIHERVLHKINIRQSGNPIPVHGVTGTSMGWKAIVTLGFEFDGGHKCPVNNHQVVVLNNLSCAALLGRDFLERFDVMSFRDGTVKIIV